jgi:hypothetical protein
MTMMAAMLAAVMAASGPIGDDANAVKTPAPTTPERGELVTDRPDFTESSLVVGKGIWQLETGAIYGGEGAARAFAAPQALLRVGVSRNLELRFGTAGVLAERDGAGFENTVGGADFELGAKLTLLDEEKHGIAMSVIPIVSFPTGSTAFTSGGVDPTVKFTWARDLPSGFGLSGNFNVMSQTEEDQRFTRGAWSLSLGHDLAFGWGGYAEVFGFSSLEKGGGQAWTFNGGVTHPVGPDRQVDITVGKGVSDAADDWFVSAGFSLRGGWRR